jgi:hypothetical protein
MMSAVKTHCMLFGKGDACQRESWWGNLRRHLCRETADVPTNDGAKYTSSPVNFRACPHYFRACPHYFSRTKVT